MEAIGKDVMHLHSGEGRSLWMLGETITVKVSGEDTDGELELVHATVPPRGGPPHIHSREDECFYVLEGEFEFLAGDETVRASAGSFVHAPKGVAHTYNNVGETPGKFLVTVTPASFEKFFEEVGQPAADRSSTPPLP